MKRIIILLSFIIILFSLSCSDMVNEVSNPEGTGPSGTPAGVWDVTNWDECTWQ